MSIYTSFSTIEAACSDSNCFATIANGKVNLKQDHKKSQMALSKVHWCDLVIYTHQNFTVERIKYNEDIWDNMQLKMTDF